MSDHEKLDVEIRSDSCEEISVFLVPWHSGELAEEPTRAISNHLKACSACRAEEEELRAVRTLLRELPGPSQDPAFQRALRASILATVEGEAAPGGAPSLLERFLAWFEPLLARPALIPATGVALGLFAFFVFMPGTVTDAPGDRLASVPSLDEATDGEAIEATHQHQHQHEHATGTEPAHVHGQAAAPTPVHVHAPAPASAPSTPSAAPEIRMVSFGAPPPPAASGRAVSTPPHRHVFAAPTLDDVERVDRHLEQVLLGPDRGEPLPDWVPGGKR